MKQVSLVHVLAPAPPSSAHAAAIEVVGKGALNNLGTQLEGLYTDVTLEAEAAMHSACTESRFRDVVWSASDWVREIDEHLNLIYVSKRISETLKTSPSAAVGRHIFSLGEFEENPSRPGLAASLMPFRGRIVLMPDKRGQIRRISMTGVAVFDKQSGAFVGCRGTGTDVPANSGSKPMLIRRSRFSKKA